MTRGALGRATRALAVLASLPTGYGHGTGDAAKNLTMEEALRIEARIARAGRNGTAMNLAQLVHFSGRRARARVTHPHKRYQ